jgi:hypothetical protein
MISSVDRQTKADGQVWANLALRIGYIIAARIPENESGAGKFIEYDVLVPQVDQQGVEAFCIYEGCRALVPMGSVADYVSSTFRSIQNLDSFPSEEELKQTTKVLLLCVNGRTDSPYIIGAAQHSMAQGQDKEEGHHFKFVFNGVTLLINKDGELSAEFKGATKADGELADEADPEASGTKLSIAKDGSFLVTTNPEGEKPQFILVDHANKRMELSANTGYSVQVQDGPALLSAKQDVVVESEAKVELTSSSDTVIKSKNGNVNIDGESPGFGVVLGGGSDAMLKGTSYRNQEALANQNVAAMLQTASVALMSAAAACLAPVTGPVIASPLFVTAATALASASAAIQAFEAQAPTYLSIKHKND